jgi:hypothetical protein
MRNWSIESFLEYLEKDYDLIGLESIKINHIAPIDKGTINDISFCSSEGKEGLESVLKSNRALYFAKKVYNPAFNTRMALIIYLDSMYL